MKLRKLLTIYNTLLERFGEPIGKTPKPTVGIADEGPGKKSTWKDKPLQRSWHDPNVINETVVELDSQTLSDMISSMDPDEISQDDFVDSSTGEIVLAQGKPARWSVLHPQHALDAKEKRVRNKAEFDALDAEWAEEDNQHIANVQAEFDSAVENFVASWSYYDAELGDPSDLASDAASSFFAMNPQWKKWAQELHLDKVEIHSMLTDLVYDAMVSGKT